MVVVVVAVAVVVGVVVGVGVAVAVVVGVAVAVAVGVVVGVAVAVAVVVGVAVVVAVKPMKDIIRYDFRNVGQSSTYASPTGDWCKWTDVEALQAELRDSCALLLAAIHLLPEDATMGELIELRVEAREVLLGKDKKTISRLEDQITALQLELDNAKKPDLPGVSEVLGFYNKTGPKYPLAFESIQRDVRGNFVIEVRLP